MSSIFLIVLFDIFIPLFLGLWSRVVDPGMCFELVLGGVRFFTLFARKSCFLQMILLDVIVHGKAGSPTRMITIFAFEPLLFMHNFDVVEHVGLDFKVPVTTFMWTLERPLLVMGSHVISQDGRKFEGSATNVTFVKQFSFTTPSVSVQLLLGCKALVALATQ